MGVKGSPAFTRDIFCSYKLFDEIKKRYPRRLVHAEVYAPPNYFYYFNRKSGSVRLVNTLDWTIWACDWGNSVAYAMKRIR